MVSARVTSILLTALVMRMAPLLQAAEVGLPKERWLWLAGTCKTGEL
jgi:hypothetical protein